MPVLPIQTLLDNMPIGSDAGIDAQDMNNIVLTMEARTSQRVLALTGSYDAVDGDNLSFVTVNAPAANIFRVPANASVGWEVAVMQIGAGQTTIDVAGGTLRHSDGHTKIAKQDAIIWLKVFANPGSAPLVAFTGETAL